MSHIATNWAFSQKGLKPAEKLLLLCLADRHNPDHGCFPSQSRLAEDANMSRSSVNNLLAALEGKGLLRREQRQNETTKRQQSTRYILGFEEDYAQEPCPNSGHGAEETEQEQNIEPCLNSGHGAVSNLEAEPCPKNDESRVQNLDTNLVRLTNKITYDEERASAREYPDFISEICIALGQPHLTTQPFWKQEAESGQFIRAWRDLGLHEEDILRVAKQHAAEVPEAPNGPKGLQRAMEREARQIAKADRKSRTVNTPLSDKVAFWAGKIAEGRYIAPSALSAGVRAALIGQGHVTEDELRRRGI